MKSIEIEANPCHIKSNQLDCHLTFFCFFHSKHDGWNGKRINCLYYYHRHFLLFRFFQFQMHNFLSWFKTLVSMICHFHWFQPEMQSANVNKQANKNRRIHSFLSLLLANQIIITLHTEYVKRLTYDEYFTRSYRSESLHLKKCVHESGAFNWIRIVCPFIHPFDKSFRPFSSMQCSVFILFALRLLRNLVYIQFRWEKYQFAPNTQTQHKSCIKSFESKNTSNSHISRVQYRKLKSNDVYKISTFVYWFW